MIILTSNNFLNMWITIQSFKFISFKLFWVVAWTKNVRTTICHRDLFLWLRFAKKLNICKHVWSSDLGVTIWMRILSKSVPNTFAYAKHIWGSILSIIWAYLSLALKINMPIKDKTCNLFESWTRNAPNVILDTVIFQFKKFCKF